MARQQADFAHAYDFLDTIFGADVHAKRVLSLSQAAIGVISSGSLASIPISLADP